jgi:hypothetical protein
MEVPKIGMALILLSSLHLATFTCQTVRSLITGMRWPIVIRALVVPFGTISPPQINAAAGGARQHELLNTTLLFTQSVSVAVFVGSRFRSFLPIHSLHILLLFSTPTLFHHTRHTTLPCPRVSTFPLPLMEDESHVPRGVVGGSSPSDTDAGSHAAFDATAALATAAAEDTGHMQKQHQQEEHGVGAGDSEPGPFASTGDEGSLFTTRATATSPTTDTPATHSGHATGEHKEPISPTDLPASPRSGGTAGFVAPSSYLRPLAVTRDREDQPRTASQPFTASETGAKRPMHPLDREQREGLVSGFCPAFSGMAILESPSVCMQRSAG